ncbi:hypothetical protein ABIA33_002008 [Streptacidiphilus sp. MAP12-16]|uniref:hypothetical protein n=1 Tax=Streptacidiphilus sp. MAP12-16 TaxID=3156300 RepID=UPI003518D4C9
MATTDDVSRPLFVCQDCGTHYLPPGDMAYEASGPASEVFCATCQPAHTPDNAARPGVNLAENVRKPRSRAPRHAGRSPARRSTDAGGDPGGRRR